MLGGKVLDLAISRLCVCGPYLGNISAISRQYLGSCSAEGARPGVERREQPAGRGWRGAAPGEGQTLPRHFLDTS